MNHFTGTAGNLLNGTHPTGKASPVPSRLPPARKHGVSEWFSYDTGFNYLKHKKKEEEDLMPYYHGR
jgi:hypothetical protein